MGDLIGGNGPWLFAYEEPVLAAIALIIDIYAVRPLYKLVPQAKVANKEVYEAVQKLVVGGHDTLHLSVGGRIVPLQLAHKGNRASIVFPLRNSSHLFGERGFSAYVIGSDGTIVKQEVAVCHPRMPLDDSTTWRLKLTSAYEVDLVLAALRRDPAKKLHANT